MKKTLIAFIAGLALALAVVVPMKTSARAAAPPERHPEIRAAMNHLRMAKENLEKAKHDFGGHRVKALEHTNQALEECRLALESDEK